MGTDFFALADDRSTLIMAACGTACSFVGTVLTMLSFLRFAWLRAPPRDIVFCFVLTDMLACVLTAIALGLGNSFSCASTLVFVFVYQFCFLQEYLWQACLCCSVYLSLDAMNMTLSDAAGSAEMLMARRKRAKLYRRGFRVVSWTVPAITTAAAFATFPGCDDENGTPFYAYAVLDMLSYTFNVAMCCVNAAKARRCMELLDLRRGAQTTVELPASSSFSRSRMARFFPGASKAAETGASGPAGSVISGSVKEVKTYIGMATLFGLSRAPAVALSLQCVIQGDTEGTHALHVLQALLLPLQGFAFFLWFSYKFRFAALWRREFKVWNLRRWERRRDAELRRGNGEVGGDDTEGDCAEHRVAVPMDTPLAARVDRKRRDLKSVRMVETLSGLF